MLLSSQVQHVQDLEAILRKKHHLHLASGLWSRYIRGEVVPQGAITGPSNSLVDRIGKIFPNTLPPFYTPLWDLLEWKPAIDLQELKSIYLSLGDKVYVDFVAGARDHGERSPPEQGRFWHRKKSIEDRRGAIQRCQDPWDRLIVCLLEGRMSYAAQNIEAFVDCQLMAAQLIASFQKLPEFAIKRLQGVLLIMEALCLDALLLNVEQPPPPPKDLIHLRAKGEAYQATKTWAFKCLRYIDSLSPSSQKMFVERLKNGTLAGKLSYFWDV